MDEYDQDIEIPSCIFFDSFDSVSFFKIDNGCNSKQSRSTVNIGLNTVLNFKIELGTNASNVQGIKNIVSIEEQRTASDYGNDFCFLTFQHEVAVTEHLVGDTTKNSGNSMDSTIYGYWLPMYSTDTCGVDSKNTTQKKRELIQYGVRFDNTNEKFVPFVIENEQRLVKRFFDIAKDMVPYTNNETVLNMNNWDILSSHVNGKLLSKILPRHLLFDSNFEKTKYYCYYVDSTMSTREEVENLQIMLNSDKSTQTDVNVENVNTTNNSFSEGENINYTYIKFKSSQAIRPNFKMTDFLDRSYYLKKLASMTSSCSDCVSSHTTEKIGDGLVGEFQVSYIHMYCLGNYGSALQWHNIIELFQTASQLQDMIDISDFYKMLKLQIVLLPGEYVHSFINLKIWEKCFFKLIKKHRGQSELERFIKQRLFNSSLQEGEEEEEEDSGDRIVELDENNFTLLKNKRSLHTGDNLESRIGEFDDSGDDDDDHAFVYINHTSSEIEDEYDDPDDDNLPSGYTVVNQVVYRKV